MGLQEPRDAPPIDEYHQYSEVVREGLQLRYPDTHFFFDSIACRAMRFQKRQGLMEGNAFDTIAGTCPLR